MQWLVPYKVVQGQSTGETGTDMNTQLGIRSAHADPCPQLTVPTMGK